MASPKSQRTHAAPSAPAKLGFGHWMRRVLAEHSKAGRELHPDTVHDLRVALRRCRSMADGLMEVDSDPAWGEMKKSGRKIFRRLGELRDTHVMIEWVQKLEPPGDTPAQHLLASLRQREWHLKQQTAAALTRFDRVQWKTWAKYMNDRAVRVPLDGPVFRHIALQRWQEAYDLHRRALRNRSRTSWHRLRIGVKRFRYTVENFLPSAHAAWAPTSNTFRTCSAKSTTWTCSGSRWPKPARRSLPRNALAGTTSSTSSVRFASTPTAKK